MRSRLARMVVSILVMLSLAAPASAWHTSNQPLPTVTASTLGGPPAIFGADHHEQAVEGLPVSEQADNHAHNAASDVLGISSCCDLGCHAALATMTGDLSSSLPRAASPSAMTEFALDQGSSGLFRPPRLPS